MTIVTVLPPSTASLCQKALNCSEWELLMKQIHDLRDHLTKYPVPDKELPRKLDQEA